MEGEKIGLKEYFDMRFENAEKGVNAALAAAKEAVIKAENATEKRFEGVNEFRNTLADQQRTLIPRAEAELIIKGISDRLKVVEDLRIEKTGESGGAKNLWVVIVSVIGTTSVLFGFLTYFIK